MATPVEETKTYYFKWAWYLVLIIHKNKQLWFTDTFFASPDWTEKFISREHLVNATSEAGLLWNRRVEMMLLALHKISFEDETLTGTFTSVLLVFSSQKTKKTFVERSLDI